MIRVLVVGQSPLLCSIVEAVIKGESDMRLIGRAMTAEVALGQAARSDVVLAPCRLPQNGVGTLLRAIATEHVQVKVLVMDLSGSEPEAIVHCIEQGAAGYVLREDSAEALLKKIRAAYKGQPQIEPHIAAALMARIAELANNRPHSLTLKDGLLELTEREREVLQLLGRNLTNREIAERLVIEVGTVKNHVHSILKKLDVPNRQQAAACLPVRHWLAHSHSAGSVVGSAVPSYL